MKPKGITEDCLVFRDKNGKVEVNVIPLDLFKFLPRVGDRVRLPGIDDYGQGLYQIETITHYYANDLSSNPERGDVRLLNITAEVTLVRPNG